MIDKSEVIGRARQAGREVGKEIAEVHGPIWEGQENLAKLIISLTSAILVGSVTFSGDLVGMGSSSAQCPMLLVSSWIILYLAMCSAGLTLWLSLTLKSFRARLTNAEPSLKEQAEAIDPNLTPEKILEKSVGIVRRYANSVTEPIGRADCGTRYSLNVSLILFCLGLGLFLWFGSLQIT